MIITRRQARLAIFPIASVEYMPAISLGSANRFLCVPPKGMEEIPAAPTVVIGGVTSYFYE
jgi:hypothetical protein